jgi:hypothetical protein
MVTANPSQMRSCGDRSWNRYAGGMAGAETICVQERPGPSPRLLLMRNGWLSSSAHSLHASFIHADLTQDHFLGEFQAGQWKTLALIDLGDTMLGNLYYELAALHLDFFNCDTRLLSAFLQAYGLPLDKDFVCKAMVTSLFHQFDVYAPLFTWKPEFKESSTLDELAERIWNIDD